MDELKPCPFCGGKAGTVRRWQSGDGTGKDIWIRCENCGMETIRYDTDEDAIAAWNRRAEPENKPLKEENHE